MKQDPQTKSRLDREPVKVKVRMLEPAKVAKRPMVHGYGISFVVEQTAHDRMFARFAGKPFQCVHLQEALFSLIPCHLDTDPEEHGHFLMRVADRLIQRWRKAGIIVKGSARTWVLTALVPTP